MTILADTVRMNAGARLFLGQLAVSHVLLTCIWC